MKKLFIVHLGYYDTVSDGIYESHTNMLIVANDFEEAKRKIKEKNQVKEKNMHIDGLQIVEAVEGHLIQLIEQPVLNGQTITVNDRYRELANKNKST